MTSADRLNYNDRYTIRSTRSHVIAFAVTRLPMKIVRGKQVEDNNREPPALRDCKLSAHLVADLALENGLDKHVE